MDRGDWAGLGLGLGRHEIETLFLEIFPYPISTGNGNVLLTSNHLFPDVHPCEYTSHCPTPSRGARTLLQCNLLFACQLAPLPRSFRGFLFFHHHYHNYYTFTLATGFVISGNHPIAERYESGTFTRLGDKLGLGSPQKARMVQEQIRREREEREWKMDQGRLLKIPTAAEEDKRVQALSQRQRPGGLGARAKQIWMG